MIDKFKPVDLEKTVSSKDLPKRPEITSERKARGREEYKKRVNEIILAAVLKHVKGVSHRGFRVGASTLEDNPRVEGGYKIEAAHNFKPRELKQFGWDKLCAEVRACSTAILDEAEYIPAIVVVSHHKEIGTDPEDKLHNGEALHSCWNCRNIFRELLKEGIMSDETIIRFVNDESLVYEDPDDMETLTGVRDIPTEKILLPKLKFRKENITEQDMAELPYEELTLKEFLSMPGYRNDDPPIPGKAIPPYKLVWAR